MLQCAKCKRAGGRGYWNDLQQGLTDQLFKRCVKNSAWKCADCKTCYLCKKAHSSIVMITCNSCDSGVHMFCLHNDTATFDHTDVYVCGMCKPTDHITYTEKSVEQIEEFAMKYNEHRATGAHFNPQLCSLCVNDKTDSECSLCTREYHHSCLAADAHKCCPECKATVSSHSPPTPRIPTRATKAEMTVKDDPIALQAAHDADIATSARSSSMRSMTAATSRGSVEEVPHWDSANDGEANADADIEPKKEFTATQDRVGHQCQLHHVAWVSTTAVDGPFEPCLVVAAPPQTLRAIQSDAYAFSAEENYEVYRFSDENDDSEVWLDPSPMHNGWLHEYSQRAEMMLPVALTLDSTGTVGSTSVELTVDGDYYSLDEYTWEYTGRYPNDPQFQHKKFHAGEFQATARKRTPGTSVHKTDNTRLNTQIEKMLRYMKRHGIRTLRNVLCDNIAVRTTNARCTGLNHDSPHSASEHEAVWKNFQAFRKARDSMQDDEPAIEFVRCKRCHVASAVPSTSDVGDVCCGCQLPEDAEKITAFTSVLCWTKNETISAICMVDDAVLVCHSTPKYARLSLWGRASEGKFYTLGWHSLWNAEFSDYTTIAIHPLSTEQMQNTESTALCLVSTIKCQEAYQISRKLFSNLAGMCARPIFEFTTVDECAASSHTSFSVASKYSTYGNTSIVVESEKDQSVRLTTLSGCLGTVAHSRTFTCKRHVKEYPCETNGYVKACRQVRATRRLHQTDIAVSAEQECFSALGILKGGTRLVYNCHLNDGKRLNTNGFTNGFRVFRVGPGASITVFSEAVKQAIAAGDGIVDISTPKYNTSFAFCAFSCIEREDDCFLAIGLACKEQHDGVVNTSVVRIHMPHEIAVNFSTPPTAECRVTGVAVESDLAGECCVIWLLIVFEGCNECSPTDSGNTTLVSVNLRIETLEVLGVQLCCVLPSLKFAQSIGRDRHLKTHRSGLKGQKDLLTSRVTGNRKSQGSHAALIYVTSANFFPSWGNYRLREKSITFHQAVETTVDRVSAQGPSANQFPPGVPQIPTTPNVHFSEPDAVDTLSQPLNTERDDVIRHRTVEVHGKGSASGAVGRAAQVVDTDGDYDMNAVSGNDGTAPPPIADTRSADSHAVVSIGDSRQNTSSEAASSSTTKVRELPGTQSIQQTLSGASPGHSLAGNGEEPTQHQCPQERGRNPKRKPTTGVESASADLGCSQKTQGK
eukprot:m.77461 g.77461  ORF g.77461 m.77461 type:complete len:1209 (-) comp16201_c0_seq3:3128-6754(-)